MKELKPCPYCGNTDIARLGETPDALWCPKCCTQGPRDHWKGSSLSDIDAWNALPRHSDIERVMQERDLLARTLEKIDAVLCGRAKQ